MNNLTFGINDDFKLKKSQDSFYLIFFYSINLVGTIAGSTSEECIWKGLIVQK
jgi:hypothetical protein